MPMGAASTCGRQSAFERAANSRITQTPDHSFVLLDAVSLSEDGDDGPHQERLRDAAPWLAPLNSVACFKCPAPRVVLANDASATGLSLV